MSEQSRRIHQRYIAKVPVRIITENGEVDAEAVNISLGGMRVKTDVALDFGSTVNTVFRLPTLDVDTEVEATVRWLDEGFCGLQFGSLRARDVWGLNRIFENARRLGDD